MRKINNKIKKIGAVTLATVMLGITMLSNSNISYVYAESATVQTINDQIASLQAKQDELESKIASIENEQASQSEYKEYLDSLVTTVTTKISAQEALLEELEANIDSIKSEIEEHDKAISETTEKIKERMLANQQAGQSSYLDVIIGSEGLRDFLSRIEIVNNLMDYDKTNLDQFKKEKEVLELEKSELETSLTLQEEIKADLEKDKEKSETLANQTTSYLNNLANDKAAYEAEYKKAKAQEAALDAQLTEYLKSLAAQNSSQVVADGQFMWPLPSGGYISCYFGDSDPNGAPHYAVDTAISAGTPIYASNDGTVVRAEWHYSYGNYVVIDHGNGYSTLYAHCSGLAISAGQTVAKGQVIGYVGSTGFSTGNHLHFEFRVNGSKTNPLNYMSKG